jgi:hypothetical protein
MSKYVKIEGCKSCPNIKIERDSTEDSFETCFKYTCKEDGHIIDRYVDWYDHRWEKKVHKDCRL